MIYNYEIKQTKQFELELRNIYNYLLFHFQEPITAEKNLRNIIEKVYSLQYYPERFPRITTYNHDNYNLRKLSVKNYIVIYQVNNDTHEVYILHIFHSSQDYYNKI